MVFVFIPLFQGGFYVADTKDGLGGMDDMPVEDRVDADIDIVLGHDDLLGDTGDLKFDVDLDEFLGDRVDLGQTGIDGFVELAKTSDQANEPL